MINGNKGTVQDHLAGAVLLIFTIVVIAIGLQLGNEFNDQVQDSNLSFNAKNISQTQTNDLERNGNMLFSAIFIGLFVGSMLSAMLVRVVSPVFLVISFVFLILSMLGVGLVDMLFEEIFSEPFFNEFLQSQYMANWYFNNIFIVNTAWAFMLLGVTYISRGRGEG